MPEIFYFFIKNYTLEVENQCRQKYCLDVNNADLVLIPVYIYNVFIDFEGKFDLVFF